MAGDALNFSLHSQCAFWKADDHPAPSSQMAEKGIGFVGDITSIQPGLIRTLVEGDYIPVVASVAADFDGQALNVNADIAAGEVSPSTAYFVLGRNWVSVWGFC